MRRSTRLVTVAASMLVASMLATGDEPVRLAPLHVIPTENLSAHAIAAGTPLRVRLTSSEPVELARALGITVPGSQASFEYVLDQYPQLQGESTRTWLESTFVIDYTEPAFDPLRKELDARGPKTTRPQLVEYVANLIEASDERAWDLASAVASRRRGDCSEHAVLTAALARLRGIPARVVLGVAVVSDEKRHGAFGHAWAEMLEDGKWRVADAALFDEKLTVRYLPIGLIEDEGMGYAMDLMRLMRIWVDRVVVLGS